MERISKRRRLEELFNKYPDVPREVIVKEDVLHDGVAFTAPALEIGKGYRCKMYGGWLFTFDMATEDAKKEQKLFSVPDYIEIHGEKMEQVMKYLDSRSLQYKKTGS